MRIFSMHKIVFLLNQYIDLINKYFDSKEEKQWCSIFILVFSKSEFMIGSLSFMIFLVSFMWFAFLYLFLGTKICFPRN